jgi:hypothetical protein
MAGRISARGTEAMKLVLAGVSPYAAAQRAGIQLSTMYKSPIYKRIRDSGGDPDELAAIRKELDATRPLPRQPKKAQRFLMEDNVDS